MLVFVFNLCWSLERRACNVRPVNDDGFVASSLCGSKSQTEFSLVINNAVFLCVLYDKFAL